MKLTHVDEQGQARMVDVGDKELSDREAVAEGWIRLDEMAWAAVVESRLPKGDVLAVARIAGIAAAKRTSDLLPLCHPIPLDAVKVELSAVEERRIHVRARVRCHWRTGVEMEALASVSAALLCVYDMVKAVDRGPVIGPIQLVEKRGGRSGHWVRD